METIEVHCPDCRNILIVDRKSGKVIEVRRALVEESSGDRFEDARQRAITSKDRAEQKFEAAKEKRKTRLSELDKLFKDRADELKDKQIEKPHGIFDDD